MHVNKTKLEKNTSLNTVEYYKSHDLYRENITSMQAKEVYYLLKPYVSTSIKHSYFFSQLKIPSFNGFSSV